MEPTIPIAEIFTSPQGEGVWTGTLMTFIRTAGCCVGRPFPKERYQGFKSEEGTRVDGFPIYTEMCTTYDGRTFPCDTDYRVKERFTVEQILDEIPDGVEHACISGGEPLIHDLKYLSYELQRREIMVHIETSGTVLPKWDLEDEWVTVSPKLGILPAMIRRADEVKLLIDGEFVLENVPEFVLRHRIIYIQPINNEFTVDKANLQRCLELQKAHPTWRISTQMHKIWNVR